MFRTSGVLRTTPTDKLRLVEPACQMPVLVPEDSLSRWRALKRCLATQPDLMFVRCAVPPSEILTHCSRLSPCVLVTADAFLEELDPQRLMQTVDFGRCVRVLVKVGQDDS